MDIAIYVDGPSAMGKTRNLIQAIGSLPGDHSIQIVDIAQPPPDGVPAEVLRVLLLRKEEALPLMLVDGEAALSGRLPSAYEVLSVLPDDGTRPALVDCADSAVEFATPSRLHISLNVRSLDVSLPFYKVLFGAEPSKLKPFYAKFELEDPPINFAVNERPFEAPIKEGAVGHFGIQVKSSETVRAARARYEAAGFHVEEETQTACCYAVQTKIWVADPDLNKWEVYVVTEDDSEAGCGPTCICLPCYMQMRPSYATRAAAGASAR
ncbi:MAG: VOC family protein [Chloroflexi bacterium]|nr:VOC family protein [Chloroflexota bacterium]